MKKFLLAIMCLTLLPISPSRAQEGPSKTRIALLVCGVAVVGTVAYLYTRRTYNPENSLPKHFHEKKHKKPKLSKHTDESPAEEKQEVILSEPTPQNDTVITKNESPSPIATPVHEKKTQQQTVSTPEPKPTPILENTKASTNAPKTEESQSYFDRYNHYWD